MRCSLFICLFAFSLFAKAQKEISLMLKVEDQVTHRLLSEATVTASSKHSATVDTLSAIVLMKNTPETIYIGVLSGRFSENDTINVCVEKEGYERTFAALPITSAILKNVEVNIAQTISIKRVPRTLGEANVTASKIMMVNKGDTIIYNADYFQLAEGSMLDELISRLPGVKLESGGRITINGNFVSSLLINGKDFFKGDATVALENLPAYMVSKVKAYQKSPGNAYITRDSLKAEISDPWVIDVNLKRDYAQGWIANAEAGYGTEERYLARLFGLRFTDLSRLSLFANFNNTNDNSRPGGEGTWNSFEPVVGQSETKTGGMSYGVDSKNQNTSFSSNITITHNDDGIRTESSSETFLTGSNAYVRSRNNEMQKNTILNLDAALSHSAKKAYFSWENYFYYRKKENAFNMCSAESGFAPSENHRGAMLDSLFVLKNYARAAALTNYCQDISTQNTTNWSYVSFFNTDIRLSRSHYISLQLNGRYSHTSNDLFSHYALFMPKASDGEDYRNKYQTMPQREYQWWAYANAPFYEKGIVKLVAAYTYRQEYYSDNRSLYRLDLLGGEWSQSSGRSLGMLPSTGDSLTLCADNANTYHSNRHLYRHTPELQAQFFFKKGAALTLLLPVNFERDVLSDLRQKDHRSRISKHYVGFEPRIMFSINGLNLEARQQLTVPMLTYMLDVRDDSNPLAVRLGNPSLRATDTYSLSAKYSKTLTKYAQNYYVGVVYQSLHNAVGQSRLYNTATGVTTYKPRNINGN